VQTQPFKPEKVCESPSVLYAYRCGNPSCDHREEFNLSIKSDASVKQMCRKGCGMTMERDIVANLQASTFGTAALARDRKFPFASDSLPEYANGASHDGEGRAIIESRRHAKEVAKANGVRWD
jgi:hypothetical protein